MDYVVYKGEEIVCVGSLKECAEQMGVKKETVKFYTTPTYRRRIAKRKRARNYITVIKLEEE
jgi:hypothetical protein